MDLFSTDARTASMLRLHESASRVPGRSPSDTLGRNRRPPMAPKQAFRVATGGSLTSPSSATSALRVFQRLGFQTSAILGSPARAAWKPPSPKYWTRGRPWLPQQLTPPSPSRPWTDSIRWLLTATIAELESSLDGSDAEQIQEILQRSGLDEVLVDSALIVRERVGMIDTLIHAAVITQVLP